MSSELETPSQPETQIEIEPLEGPLADLTVAFALEEKVLPSLTFPGVQRFEWDGLDVSPGDATIHAEGTALVVSFGAHPLGFDHPLGGGHSAKLTFADGSTATGSGYLVRKGMSPGPKGNSACLEFRIYRWDWDTGARSTFLVGKASGLPKLVSDNLFVQRGWRFSSQHFRGRGNALWHLIATSDGHVAVVERGEASIDQLRQDLHVLEFVFGGDIDLSTFRKVDDSGSVVGALDLDRAPPVTHGRRVPVPWGPLVRECWTAHLFESISKVYAEDIAVRTAANGYLDALSGHIHSAYLLAQVALEASCSSWHRPERSTLVQSPSDWEAWVDGQAPAIRAQAATPESGQQLINKIKSGSIQGSTSNLVAAAFEAAGIVLDRETLEEVRLRNSVAHRYYMASDEALLIDSQREAVRIHVIQTLLAMVVALRAGYQGPLAGWTKDSSRHLEPTPIWPDKFPREQLKYFVCGRESPVH